MPERGPITLTDAAERLQIHYMTAYRYVRTGRLPAERAGARWMVDPADLDRLRPRGRRPRGQGRTAARRQLEDRLLAGDEAGAWSVIEAALAAGMDPDEVHLELTAPALRSIGDRWAAGAATVGDEHRATAVAARLVGRLGPRFARPRPQAGRGRPRAPRSTSATPCPDPILADLLRRAGFEVVDLGADTPAESFVETAARADRLVAVLIGATGPGHDAALAGTPRPPSGARSPASGDAGPGPEPAGRRRSSSAGRRSPTPPTPPVSGPTGGRATTVGPRSAAVEQAAASG